MGNKYINSLKINFTVDPNTLGLSLSFMIKIHFKVNMDKTHWAHTTK